MSKSSDGSSAKSKVLVLAILILSLAGLAFAWRWTSISSWINIQRLVGELRQLGGSFGPLSALACVSIASIVAIPLAVIIIASAIAFGPWLGLAYALCGASGGAAISYGIGNYLGHEALCRLAGKRVNRLSVQLAKRGILSVILLRMVPIAPFAIVNMIAGTTHIRLRDFLAGTFVGMLPGGLAMTVFADQIVIALVDPSWESWGILALTSALIVVGVLGFRRWAGQAESKEDA